MTVKMKRGSALGSLSLTPLIDIVFLLLIFFLVATRFAQEDRELDVTLPSASSARPLTVQPKELFVNVDQRGQYFVDGVVMQSDEVKDVLQRAKTDNPVNQSVIIRADRRVQFDFVVTVMDLCNQVGIHDYTVTTKGDD